MKNKLKRLLAVLMTAVFLLPSGTLYAGAIDMGKVGVKFEHTNSYTVLTNQDTVKTELSKGEKYTYSLILNTQKSDYIERIINRITIHLEEAAQESIAEKNSEIADIQFDENSQLTLDNGILKASINKMPKSTEGVELTLEVLSAMPDDKAYNATITVDTDKRERCYPEVQAAADADKFTLSAGHKDTNRNGDYYKYDDVLFAITPDDGYTLKSFEILYAKKNDGNYVVQKITSSTNYEEWSVNWNTNGQTTITGQILGYMTKIQNVEVEKIPNEYTVKVRGDSGITIDRPSSGSITVTEGQNTTVNVTATAKSGYLFSDCIMQIGKSYGSWIQGQSFLTLGNTRIEVNDSGSTVSFIIPNELIYDDITVNFSSTFDHNNIPITINETYSKIDIYTDSPETVQSGSDAMFYISTTSSDYIVSEISLKVGDLQSRVDPDNGEIVVGDKKYQIYDMGDGVYTLLVEDITEPITVSAKSVKTSVNVSRPSLSITPSSNVKITKSTSSYYIDSGDNVYFYFTPNTNYQISEITLKVGNLSKTVSTSKTSITVGDKTYMLSRNAAGMVTLYLTNVTQNVTVSASAYFSKDDVTATTAVSLNTDTRSPFITGYTDGTFKPKNNMTKAEAVSMLYKMANISNISNESVFADVPSSAWYASEVNTFASAGIIDKTTYFYPNNYITRGEMVELIYRMVGSPSITTSNVYFLDVANTQNNNAIRYCASKGWIDGYSDGTFRPYKYMTRDEVVAVMCRVTNRTYGSMAQKYKDVSPSYWAYSYIQMASSYI